MKLLLRNNHAVVIFGLGLVGSAILLELSRHYTEIGNAKLNWASTPDCLRTLSDVISVELPKSVTKIDIIWAAGKTGFLATQDDVIEDYKRYTDLNDGFAKLVQKASSAKIRYILISSAGGLFEGQTHVGGATQPVTLRPYGELKLKQENYVRNADWISKFVLMRLSSVYTVDNLGSRLGLIPTIMTRAIRKEFVTIFGTEMTLRDYVLDKDIALYVAQYIDKEMPEEAFIIDGKPYSILEIKNHIERIIGNKVYLKYTLMKSNAANMSFSPNIRAAGFRPSDLNTNLRILYDNLTTGIRS